VDKTADSPWLSAYVTNAGRYAAGLRAGEWLRFPTTKENVQALLKRIGVDGIRHEELFITAYDSNVRGIRDCLGEYESLDALHFLSFLLTRLDKYELERFEAIAFTDARAVDLASLINITQNLECFEYFPGVTDDETLGRIYVDDMEMLDVPEDVRPYFDYEAYGRDMRINENGRYAPDGYVIPNGTRFVEVYHGPQDIPKEQRVFAYPKLSIREQMAAYKATKKSAQSVERADPTHDHDER